MTHRVGAMSATVDTVHSGHLSSSRVLTMQINGTVSRMYRVKAVAQMLDVSVSTVYRLAQSGQLQAVRVGPRKGALRIPEDSLNAYLASVGVTPISAASGREGLMSTADAGCGSAE
jgi:excisionase family DNA binding protein